MTISQNSDYVLEHPFTKAAVKAFLSGNPKDLKFIFEVLQIDVYQETAGLCTRAFRSNKRENYPQIEEAIREVEPPKRLSCKLPIPPVECIVVKMKVKAKRINNPMQLCLDFTKRGIPLLVAL